MSSLIRLAGVLALVLSTSTFACGPDFPFEFLSHRDQTLASLPDSLFLLEAQRLVSPPAQRFAVVEGVEGDEPAQTPPASEVKAAELYRAGAALWATPRRAAARPHFEKLLALPEGERRGLTLPAEYSLAELSAPAEARSRFTRVRELATAGWPDPRGLAAASLGEEARLALGEGDDVHAIALYAEQASHGSTVGAVSLLFVARQLIADEARLTSALTDPLAQRLVATYLWTRASEDWWSQSANGHTPAAILERLAGLPSVAGADHLAAALFRAGRFEDAERLAQKEQTPIAHWVKAKLLLRKGHREEADQELELAAEGYPLSEAWTVDYQPDYRPRQQLELERSIIALSRDDFEGAMRHALASCSWEDVAYLAERVLDVETVKRILDAPAPSPNPCAPLKGENEVDTGEGWKVADQHQDLRSVLARRLLREGRGQEALPYFDAKLRPFADQYVQALAQRGQGQAQGLYVASQIARQEGLELLGYEGAPDYAWTGGNYSPGLELKPDSGVSAEEWRRYQASGPKYPMRYQYRAQASHLAEQAADLVSPRSQAFTALLCRAAAYVGSRDDARAAALWKRAVKEGPLLSEPMIFGEECPAPRFEPPPPPRAKPLHVRKRTLAAGGAGLLGVAAVLVLRRRRKRS